MYTYNYGVDNRGHFFEVFLDGHFWAEISSAAGWESTKTAQIKLVDLPFPDEAKNVVENWFKFVQVPKKAAGQFRKALGYTKSSFDAVRSKFGANRDGTNEHATPPYVLEFAREFGPIALDPFAMAGSFVNAKNNYFYPKNDGMKDPWISVCLEERGNLWANPPFDVENMTKFAEKWTGELYQYRKFTRNIKGGNFTPDLISIVPANRSEQEWWHVIVPYVSHVVYFKNRVDYFSHQDGDLVEKKGVGYPSCMLIATEKPYSFMQNLAQKWAKKLTIVSTQPIFI